MPNISSQPTPPRFSFLIFVSFFCLITFKAQSETLTASMILQKIEENYGHNKEFQLIEKQASHNENNATALYNPEVVAGFGRIDNSSFKGPYQQWSLSQTFEINGQKNLARQQIKTLTLINQNQNRISQREYQVHVLQLVFQLKAEQELLTHINERLAQLDTLKIYLKNKSFVSAQDQMSRSMIENLFDEINLQKIELTNTLHVLKNNLKSILNLNANPDLNIPWLNLNKVNTQLRARILNHEAIHIIGESKVKLVDQKKNSINKEWIPDINLTYSESREIIPGGNRNDTLSVGLSIPLFNINSNSQSALSAQKEIEQLHKQRENKEFEIHYNQHFMDLSLAIDLTKELSLSYLDKKDKIERKFLKHFKQGQIEALSFIEIEKQTHAYHEHAMDANLKGHLALFEILKLTPITYSLEKILNENIL